MKILVMTQNKILGEGICLELLERGYFAEWMDYYRAGYDLYISDVDNPAENFENAENILTFSRKEGVSDIQRPFTEKEFVEKIKAKMNGTESAAEQDTPQE